MMNILDLKILSHFVSLLGLFDEHFCLNLLYLLLLSGFRPWFVILVLALVYMSRPHVY